MNKKMIFFLGFLSGIFALGIFIFLLVMKNSTISSKSDSNIDVQSDTIDIKKIEILPLNATLMKSIIDTSTKPTVFNFWASWCIPCKKEIPYLKTYCQAQGYNLCLVSVDRNNDKQIGLLKRTLGKIQIEKSYILENSSKTDLLNRDAMLQFSKEMGFDFSPQNGIPYLVLYNGKQKMSEFNGMNEENCYTSFFDEHIKTKISPL